MGWASDAAWFTFGAAADAAVLHSLQQLLRARHAEKAVWIPALRHRLDHIACTHLTHKMHRAHIFSDVSLLGKVKLRVAWRALKLQSDPNV